MNLRSCVRASPGTASRTRLMAREGARRIAVVNGGTIADRGLFGVFIAGGKSGSRVGELDEEMVFESRTGDTIILGASTWRIEEITHDKVVVSPAPGEPGKMPFWHGDAAGRPAEFGEKIGALTRALMELAPRDRIHPAHRVASARCACRREPARVSRRATHGDRVVPSDTRDRGRALPRRAGRLAHLRAYALWHAGACAVVHRHRRAAARRARPRSRIDVVGRRLRAAGSRSRRAAGYRTAPARSPRNFASCWCGNWDRRRCSPPSFARPRRAPCLLPKRRPGVRAPLWQQRKRSADLLAIAARYESFPILLETYRECMRDVFDLSATVTVLRRIQ